MRSVLFSCSLVVLSLVCAGCAEFQSCGNEIAVEGGYLHDAVEFDISYFGWLPVNTTRSDQDPWEIYLLTGHDVDVMWADFVKQNRPEPAVVVPPSAPEPIGTYEMPAKRPVVAPPMKTEVEKLEGSDVVIIRAPDGGVIVTNAPDKAGK
jgi:hypothetical protein